MWVTLKDHYRDYLGRKIASITFIFVRMGSKSARKGFNFGYQRAEALGALLTLMIIWFVTGVLVWLAGNRIAHPKSFDVDPDPMMIVAG